MVRKVDSAPEYAGGGNWQHTWVKCEPGPQFIRLSVRILPMRRSAYTAELIRKIQDSHFLTKPVAYLFLLNESLLHSLYSTNRASRSSLKPMGISGCLTHSLPKISWRNFVCRLISVSWELASAIISAVVLSSQQTFREDNTNMNKFSKVQKLCKQAPNIDNNTFLLFMCKCNTID